MFGRKTVIVRVAEHGMAPRVRVSDSVRFVPNELAAHGSFVAVRDPGRSAQTVLRRLVERGGRRLPRALDKRSPNR